MKKVLLTGIGGAIGVHVLAHIMHNTDWEVVGIDSFNHLGYFDRITEVYCISRFYSASIDIRDRRQGIIRQISITAIFNIWNQICRQTTESTCNWTYVRNVRIYRTRKRSIDGPIQA